MRRDLVGIELALAAGLLFGLVSVAAKGANVDPLVTGGAAYLLAGIVLAATLRGMRIERRDWPKVLAMSLLGGALAPALLFFGLDRVAAVTASILLTLEMAFTAILATIFLHERTRGLALLGLALLFAAAILASLPTADQGQSTLVGVALVAGAALGWGIDNTVSTRLVGAYRPHQLVAIKGLIGGAAALLLGAALGASPRMSAGDALRIAFIGLLGIGASIVLFYHALGRIGATRTSAIFLPIAALAGVLGARLLLGEPIRSNQWLALGLVATGLLLLTRRPDAPGDPAREGGQRR